MLTAEQADKIEITEGTEVAYINGEKIVAENLKRWAYRRLKGWPNLLKACEEFVFLEKTNMTKKQVQLRIDIAKLAIANAKNSQ